MLGIFSMGKRDLKWGKKLGKLPAFEGCIIEAWKNKYKTQYKKNLIVDLSLDPCWFVPPNLPWNYKSELSVINVTVGIV